MRTLTRFSALSPRTALTMAAVAAGGVGALTLTATPPVAAAPDPCAASSVARTVGGVATNTGVYLDAHPETNQALTAISQQPPGPHSVAMVKAYFDSNPEVAADMQRLQRPLVSLSARCQLPVTLPQLLGLLQAAQQGTAGTQSPAQTADAATTPVAGTRESNSSQRGGAVQGPT